MEVSFSDGVHEAFSAEFLRVHSPSAEMIAPDGQRQLVWGRAGVGISGAETVGTYAVRLDFTDGHSTGIFSWAYLRKLAARRTALKRQYIKALRHANRSRQPRVPASAAARAPPA